MAFCSQSLLQQQRVTIIVLNVDDGREVGVSGIGHEHKLIVMIKSCDGKNDEVPLLSFSGLIKVVRATMIVL